MLPRKIAVAMSFMSIKWRFISLVISILACAHPGLCQVNQTARLEIPVFRDDQNFEIIPAQEGGLFLCRRFAGEREDPLEIIKLDTAFQEKWKGYLAVDKRFVLTGKRVANERLYLLLRNRDFSRNDMAIVSIAQDSGKYITHAVKNFIPFYPSEFQVTQQAALIGGYYNRIPVVTYYSWATGKSKILGGLHNEAGELTQIKTYPDGSFDVLISAKNIQRQQTIWIKNYDPSGDLLRNYALDADENKSLLFARSLKTTNNMQVVAGVYGGRNPEYSKGLFIASVDPSGLQQTRYYSYADLENFFKYMKANREKRVKERIERRKIKGKKIRFNYRFMVHELVPYNHQYVLLGEAFFPRYVAADRGYSSGFFSPYSLAQNNYIRDGRIFDGYYYTHAVVMGFDPTGKLLWDNSFEINDVKTYTLEQFVKLEAQPDKIALLYLFENEIRTKIIKGNEVLEGKTYESIKTKIENDIIKKEIADATKLDYWYGNYFYAYGIQEINNPKFGKRRVFFINKVSYD
jgi:hypothetical protein